MRKVSQKGNRASGHIAGRDVVNIDVHEEQRPLTAMGHLLALYRKEAAKDKTLREFIDSLHYYLRPINTVEDLPSLEHKLGAANREGELDKAIVLKELFFKKLLRHQLSPAAQEIYAFILGRIHDFFIAHIKPMLADNAPQVEVNAKIVTHVINPTLELLESNELILNSQELRGMLYYLTANCHLDWRPNA